MRRLVHTLLLALLAVPALATVIVSAGPRRFIVSSSPSIGAHGQDVDIDTAGTSPSTVTLTTQTSGSVCVVMVGGSHADNSAPSDNKGNSFAQQGADADYGALWTGFGLEIWADTTCAGGTSHTFSVTKSHADWEISQAVIEFTGASSIPSIAQAYNSAAGAGVLVDGPDVTVTGPATICSAASGDGDAATSNQTLTPSRGTLIESSFMATTAYVPFAIACDTVSSAGTYDIDWTPTVNQGMAKITWAVQP